MMLTHYKRFARNSSAHLFNVRSLVMILQIVIVSIAFSQTEFEGDISGEWDTEGSPYIQVGEANVPEDETLEILPGVEVILLPESEIQINGLLTAVGTEEDTIRFHPSGGEFGGSMRLFSTEDTLNLEYCRFDSLEHVVWGHEEALFRISNCFLFDNYFLVRDNPLWAEITHSKIVCINQSANFFSGRNDNVENTQITLSDNWLQGRFHVTIQTGTAVMERNHIEEIIIDDRLWKVILNFSDCQRIICRDNQNSGMNSRQMFVGLIEATIENNYFPDEFITMRYPGDARIIINNNQVNRVSLSGATNALLTDNIAKGFGFAEGCEATLDHNLGAVWIAESDNTVTISNCTIMRSQPDGDFSPAIISHHNPENEYEGNLVILHNNIFYGHDPFPYAVNPDIEVEGEGYNYLWNVDQAYADEDELLPNDVMNEDPLLRGDYPFDYRLRADSPCIDAGDPDLEEDPDGTRADVGFYFFDQENGEQPLVIGERYRYTGWWQDFTYTANALDEGEFVRFEFENLPEWLDIQENARDVVYDSVVVSGPVPEDEEDFTFIVRAIDDDRLEDTLEVYVRIFPYTLLHGQIGGVLTRDSSPYIVGDTAWVASDDSLIFEPGVEIYCDDIIEGGRFHSVLICSSYVRAVGTEEDSIFFKTLRGVGARRMLQVIGNRDSRSEFRFCHIAGAGGYVLGQDFTVNNCWNERGSISGSGDGIHFDWQHNVGWGAGVIGIGVVANNRVSGIMTIGGDSVEVFNNHFDRGSLYVSQSQGIGFGHIHHNIIDSSAGHAGIGFYVAGGGEYENLEGTVIVNSNVISNCEIGISTARYFSRLVITNNLINGAYEVGLYEQEGEYNVLFTNNVIANSAIGMYFQDFELDLMDNLRTENNLFIDNEILFGIRHPGDGYESFKYNAAFGFDSLGNDDDYIGELVRVNANGDSVDAGFNLFTDPYIVNLDSLDFRLIEGSPLIDAGNPDASFFDLDSTTNDIGLYGGPLGETYDYPVGVGKSEVPVPEEFTLAPPFPNPFNLMTRLLFTTPKAGNVNFKVYDVIGRRVFAEQLIISEAGKHHYVWKGVGNSGGQLPIGIYYFELEFGGAKLVQRAVMLK